MRRNPILAIALIGTLLGGTGTAAVAANVSPAHPHWVLQHSPATVNLLDISCPSSTQCYAIGNNNTIIRTVNGGTKWSSVSSPIPNATLTSLRCPALDVCSMIDTPNTVLRMATGKKDSQHTITLPTTLSRLGRIACPTLLVCFVTASPSGNTETWFTHSAAISRVILSRQ
jgi:hypothetical protein